VPTGTNPNRKQDNTMTTISAVVYLNEGRENFLGFNTTAPARLREVARFDVELLDDLPANYISEAGLEVVFEQLNIESPYHPWAIAYRHAGNRSLSTGDVVVIGETAWACHSVGWTPVSTGDLHTALAE
jgi:hypothetical protein